ncbi:MAG: hypothetical protein R3E66_04020 [bacterium]
MEIDSATPQIIVGIAAPGDDFEGKNWMVYLSSASRMARTLSCVGLASAMATFSSASTRRWAGNADEPAILRRRPRGV